MEQKERSQENEEQVGDSDVLKSWERGGEGMLPRTGGTHWTKVHVNVKRDR